MLTHLFWEGGTIYAHPNVFKFKMQPWQCVWLRDANSVGWRHRNSEWEDNLPFLTVIAFHPEEDSGTHLVGCLV